MNAALKPAQFEYDNRLPVVIDDSAEREWVTNGVEQLLMGADVERGVTYERFAVAVDEFAMEQLGDTSASPSVLGRLVLLARRKATADAASAAGEALNCADPDEAIRQIAVALLAPYAKAGALALSEDAL